MRQTNGGDVPGGYAEDGLYAEVEEVTNEPMTQKKRSPWVWVSLGCIGLIAIVGIGLIIWTRNFLSSEDGKRMMEGISRSQSMSQSLPIASAGMKKYVDEKGGFPDSLDALKGYVDEATLHKVKTEMTYFKPVTDAPPETVVLTTGQNAFMQGSYMEIVMQKDFQYFQVTKSPLEER
jgi:hypothetical protein